LDPSAESTSIARPVIRLEGEVNIYTAPGIRKMLLKAARRGQIRSMEVDFSSVSAIDTSCIAVLVELARALKARGAALRLTGFGENAARMISMAALDSIFEGMIIPK
jgi:anti-anti-sigma factor